MDQAKYVHPIGSSGGLSLWWSREVTVNILRKDRNFMDTSISSTWMGRDFLATWVYGYSDQARRARNWEKLKMIQANRRDPCICLGDFNDISHHDKKIGGQRKDQRMIDEFSNMLMQLQVDDIGFKGQRWTWSNNRRGNNKISKSLDQILANTSWCYHFPKA